LVSLIFAVGIVNIGVPDLQTGAGKIENMIRELIVTLKEANI